MLTKPGETMLTALWLLSALLIIYFVPVAVAMARKHRNTVAIVVLNIFLGWTLIGWVAALVWACVNQERTAAQV